MCIERSNSRRPATLLPCRKSGSAATRTKSTPECQWRASDAAREAAWRSVLAPYYREFGLDISAAPALPARYPFDTTSAELVEELRPQVVSFHYGLPDEPLLERVRATGARILSSATTVDEALWLEERGVAAVIAQGLEAGGHRGHFLADDLSLHAGTFALVPQFVRALRTPVIAAGGGRPRRRRGGIAARGIDGSGRHGVLVLS